MLMPTLPDAFLGALAAERRAYPYPHELRERAAQFELSVLGLLFPHFARQAKCDVADLTCDLQEVERQLRALLEAPTLAPASGTDAAVAAFIGALPGVREQLMADANAVNTGDPAARSVDEVILAYPGFLAVAVHRIAHALHVLGTPLLPRLLAEHAHRETGIDIHPGATIGAAFGIDHGTGIVIGETARIGDRVKIYQGVTLGALSVSKRLASTKRHPTIEDDVVIYANATILGGDTVVGQGSVIGGNVWLTKSVPPRSVVTHSSDVMERGSDDGIEYHI
jgi:serine O-acetyltransferase